ncbi:hypothetical protein OAR00_00265 [Alphaproteobacteria bacterium]|nr:hypothetical protein [Alphaproteobacteria bacterium]MDC1022967.1 hypothetical protein [Alphaproteobacteria bacterium]
MNESIELRKRILKMRESNESILNIVQPELIKEEIKKENIPKDVMLENNKKFSFNNKKKILIEEVYTNEKSLLKKENSRQTQEIIDNSNKQNNINSANTNEIQFRILANKFNEAVQVILELSDKVKKLEHIVYKSHKDTKKRISFFYFINIKAVFSLILSTLLILGIFTLPLDFSTIKLIISDIISSM